MSMLGMCMFLGLLSSCSETERLKVGVIQTSHNETLDDTRLGLMDELRSAGFTPGVVVDLMWESASGNPALATQIAQKFMTRQCDVIVTIGTLASQMASQAMKDSKTPMIYAAVTDPKGAHLSGNLSGVSNFVDPHVHFESFKRILPGLKKMGVIHNLNEQNSVTLMTLMTQAGKDLGIEIVFANVRQASDVYNASLNLIKQGVDALFVNNDNLVLEAFDSVAKASLENKIPAFVSDTNSVKRGALAAMGPNQHRIGLQAGKMVTELLKLPKNQRDASKIKPEVAQTILLFLNQEVMDRLGIIISDSVLRDATFV